VAGSLAAPTPLAYAESRAAPARSPAQLAAGQVAVDWLALQLKLTKETPGFSPPVAARAFGYAGVALYESVVGGMPSSRSLVGQLNGLAWLLQTTRI